MAELYRFARVSKEAHDRVKSYVRRKFNITKFLKRFVTEEFIEDFRRLMAATGMIISGSVALQLFACVLWESDIDLYVDKIHAETVASWFETNGYVFQPRDVHNTDWRHLTTFNSNVFPDKFLSVEPCMPSGYLGGKNVLNFKNQDDKIIQIIMCDGTPIQSIIHFHTSELMIFKIGHY